MAELVTVPMAELVTVPRMALIARALRATAQIASARRGRRVLLRKTVGRADQLVNDEMTGRAMVVETPSVLADHPVTNNVVTVRAVTVRVVTVRVVTVRVVRVPAVTVRATAVAMTRGRAGGHRNSPSRRLTTMSPAPSCLARHGRNCAPRRSPSLTSFRATW